MPLSMYKGINYNSTSGIAFRLGLILSNDRNRILYSKYPDYITAKSSTHAKWNI